MEQIGTSHIATADLLICGFTLFIILGLHKLPASSVWSLIVATLCGCAIFAVVVALVVSDVHNGAVGELSFIAFALCRSLWDWNGRRVKSRVVNGVSPFNVTN
jgi:hypothetical protein